MLGAWATTKQGNILDIGCGTGLIALMMAQRSQKVMIDAIDIEKNACFQAEINIKKSKWSHCITVHHTSIQLFYPDKKYDVIVSNPPFFVNAYQPQQKERAIARHNEQLSFDDLIIHVVRLLKPDGIFVLILPVNEAHHFMEKAILKGLFLNKIVEVKPTKDKLVKRMLLEFSNIKNSEVSEDTLIIETEKRLQYTTEYKKLTADFYL